MRRREWFVLAVIAIFLLALGMTIQRAIDQHTSHLHETTTCQYHGRDASTSTCVTRS